MKGYTRSAESIAAMLAPYKVEIADTIAAGKVVADRDPRPVPASCKHQGWSITTQRQCPACGMWQHQFEAGLMPAKHV